MADFIDRSEVSKRVFVHRDRLAVWGRVLGFKVEPPELFCSSDIEEASRADGVRRSTAHQEIVALRDLGMIALAPEQVGGHSKDYIRIEGPGWEMVEAAVRMAEELTNKTEDT